MWLMRCWRGYLSVSRCKRSAYASADVTATPASLASLKSRMVWPFWCRLTEIVPEKRPLNGCLLSSYHCLLFYLIILFYCFILIQLYYFTLLLNWLIILFWLFVFKKLITLACYALVIVWGCAYAFTAVWDFITSRPCKSYVQSKKSVRIIGWCLFDDVGVEHRFKSSFSEGFNSSGSYSRESVMVDVPLIETRPGTAAVIQFDWSQSKHYTNGSAPCRLRGHK